MDGEMGMNESEGTDYAADNSSDHSSSATYSPRHKPTQYGDSPLARKHLLNKDNRDLLSSQPDLSTKDNVRTSLTVAQVHYFIPTFASNLVLVIDVWPIIKIRLIDSIL